MPVNHEAFGAGIGKRFLSGTSQPVPVSPEFFPQVRTRECRKQEWVQFYVDSSVAAIGFIIAWRPDQSALEMRANVSVSKAFNPAQAAGYYSPCRGVRADFILRGFCQL
jgi:hypothetical protein